MALVRVMAGPADGTIRSYHQCINTNVAENVRGWDPTTVNPTPGVCPIDFLPCHLIPIQVPTHGIAIDISVLCHPGALWVGIWVGLGHLMGCQAGHGWCFCRPCRGRERLPSPLDAECFPAFYTDVIYPVDTHSPPQPLLVTAEQLPDPHLDISQTLYPGSPKLFNHVSVSPNAVYNILEVTLHQHLDARLDHLWRDLSVLLHVLIWSSADAVALGQSWPRSSRNPPQPWLSPVLPSASRYLLPKTPKHQFGFARLFPTSRIPH